MRKKLIGRLSKGYRQRVGLAQAILHNPDVLILDEPTAGLDPKQIIETRELIKGLGGEHTIVLSTHILPEVSMTCGRVVIINKGRVVAEDTPREPHAPPAGGGRPAAGGARRRGAADALRAVPGVLAVRRHSGEGGDDHLRGGGGARAATCARTLARAVVAGGLDLLSPAAQVGMSLEEIFLHLTTADAAEPAAPPPPEPSPAAVAEAQEVTVMTALRNVWALVEKEWRHYFGSPIAYVALFVWTRPVRVLLLRDLPGLPASTPCQTAAAGRHGAQALAQRHGDRARSCTTWRWWRSSSCPC